MPVMLGILVVALAVYVLFEIFEEDPYDVADKSIPPDDDLSSF